MTRDDIIRMAQEAGFEIDCCSLEWHDRIERFANLVAAHTLSNIDPSSFMSWQEGYAAGAAAEREACAKVCEEAQDRYKELWSKFSYPDDEGRMNAANWCAAAIRARGETK